MPSRSARLEQHPPHVPCTYLPTSLPHFPFVCDGFADRRYVPKSCELERWEDSPCVLLARYLIIRFELVGPFVGWKKSSRYVHSGRHLRSLVCKCSLPRLGWLCLFCVHSLFRARGARPRGIGFLFFCSETTAVVERLGSTFLAFKYVIYLARVRLDAARRIARNFPHRLSLFSACRDARAHSVLSCRYFCCFFVEVWSSKLDGLVGSYVLLFVS